MSRLYVFAIGGSGSRVLRSLTMLLANGVNTRSEIVPMIIDPDYSNGDLVRTVDLMRLYEQIHSQLSFTNSTSNTNDELFVLLKSIIAYFCKNRLKYGDTEGKLTGGSQSPQTNHQRLLRKVDCKTSGQKSLESFALCIHSHKVLFN